MELPPQILIILKYNIVHRKQINAIDYVWS